MTLNLKEISQIGLVVEDLNQVLKMYEKVFDLQPTNIIIDQKSSESTTQYKGKITSARAKMAFFDLGKIELEIIEPVGSPSIWQDFLQEGGSGIHHLAIKVTNMQTVVQNLVDSGLEVMQSAEFPGGRYAYFDTRSSLGAILELLEFDE